MEQAGGEGEEEYERAHEGNKRSARAAFVPRMKVLSARASENGLKYAPLIPVFSAAFIHPAQP
ncbi:MAG TPA: hypothetical protein DIT64_09955 [Verrucomicrobiales bacterium]|nr:hypothetical protein [Verrucomicrobiales bacterium]